MKKRFYKRLIGCVIIGILLCNTFSINSIAEASENVDEMSVTIKNEKVDIRYPRVRDENRIYYTTTRSSAVKENGNILYGFTVKYNWSVDSRNPSSTLAVESVKVIDEVKNFSPVGGFRGPYITGGVVSGLGTASYTVKTSFLHASGVIDLFQYATLLPQGTANIRTVVGNTSK